MRIRPLVLDAETLAAIAAADARARAKPVPWSVLQTSVVMNREHLTLADRRPDGVRPQSENVLIDFGFRATISYEHQPAGMIKHLSISVDQPGKLPHPEAIKAIMEAFGIDKPEGGWLEEFDPGHECINIVMLVGPSDVPEGHA